MKLSSDKKLAGILCPVFSIRTEDDLGIGDTEGVNQMIDWCHEHGISLFQVLPINETSDDNSPYNAISSMALDPTTIAVSPKYIPDLSEVNFKEIVTPGLLKELRAGAVKYTKVKELKRSLLRAAFEAFLAEHWNKKTERSEGLRAFLSENGDWISDYAMFRVLMEDYHDWPTWDEWPLDRQNPKKAWSWFLSLPTRQRDEYAKRILFCAYVQWIAYDQWRKVKEHGTGKNVYLMGDIPFGVNRYSSDVWGNRAIFDLTWSGGCPPEKVFKVDPFTEKWGQNWGMPLYRWDEMRGRNFDWWRTRVGLARKIFHLCRVDHVMGLFRIYAFPWTPDRNAEFLPLDEQGVAARTGGRLPGFRPFPDDTAEHTAANQRQGEEMLRVILEAAGDITIVAEDLGVVPDYVRQTLDKLGIAGFRIPSFCREPDGRYCDPAQYPRLSFTQPSTHDHPPLAAAWVERWEGVDRGEKAEEQQRELRRAMEFAGLNGEPAREYSDCLHEGTLRAVLR